jgi:LPXTG-site transpeptidase (sortase) family protein
MELQVKSMRKWIWRGFNILLVGAIAVSLAMVLWPRPDSASANLPAVPDSEPEYPVAGPMEPPDPGVSAAPEYLTIDKISVAAKVVPYTAEEAKQGEDQFGKPCFVNEKIVCIDPSRTDLVYQQIGGQYGVNYGVDPGMESSGSVYFFGHSGGTKSVFDDLGKLKAGDIADVQTAYGIISYVVDEVVDIPKADYPYSEKIWEQVPGKLVLVSCDQAGPNYANGHAVNNIVAILHAESARAVS